MRMNAAQHHTPALGIQKEESKEWKPLGPGEQQVPDKQRIEAVKGFSEESVADNQRPWDTRWAWKWKKKKRRTSFIQYSHMKHTAQGIKLQNMAFSGGMVFHLKSIS